MTFTARYLRLCNRRGEDAWSILFGYPLARLALVWLERAAAIRPTHLTIVSIALRVAGAACVVRREYPWAVALLQLGQVFDAMDGTLARARGQHSARGALLDKGGDALSLGLLCAALGWIGGGAPWMAAALGGGFFHLMRAYLHWVARALSPTPHAARLDGARPADERADPLKEWLAGVPRLVLFGEADLYLWISVGLLFGQARAACIVVLVSQALAALARFGVHLHRARPVAAGLFVGIVGLASPVSAHHVASDAGITPAQPRTIGEVVFDGGVLDQGGRRASYERMSPALELRLLGRVSARVQLAVVRIAPAQARTEEGLGDSEVGVKANLLGGAHGGPLLSLGLGAKVPTGDRASGLGGGHFGLAPYLASSWEHETSDVTLVAAVLVIDMLSVSGHGHVTPAPIVLEPHGSHELTTQATLGVVTPRAWASIAGVTRWSFAAATRGFESASARALLGVRFGDGYRVYTSMEAPTTGDPGYRWRSLIGLAYVR